MHVIKVYFRIHVPTCTVFILIEAQYLLVVHTPPATNIHHLKGKIHTKCLEKVVQK